MNIDYQRLFEQMPTPYLVLDAALRVVAVNDAYLAATMTTRGQLLGRGMFEVFPGDPTGTSAGGQSLRASLEKVLKTGKRDTMPVQRYDIAVGDRFLERYWSPVNAPVIDDEGAVVLLMHRVEDVTDYVVQRQSAEESRRIDAMLSRRADSLEADLSQRARDLQEVNRRLQQARRELEGVAARHAALARLGQLALGGASISDLSNDVAFTVLRMENVDSCEVLQVLPDGRSARVSARAGWLDDDGHPVDVGVAEESLAARALASSAPLVIDDISGEGGFGRTVAHAPRGARSALAVRVGDAHRPFGLVMAYSDEPGGLASEDGHFAQSVANVLATAVDRASREEAMRHQALHDSLTGLPNRQLLFDRLERALAACRREGGCGGLMLIDLDGFKSINDTWGHQVGDAVLQQVAVRLSGALRDSDTVARLGGDEFAVLLPGLQTLDEVEVVHGRIETALGEPLQVPGGTATVRGSVGVVLFPDQGEDPHVLLQRADTAMYAAKRSGGGYVVHGDGTTP